MTIQHSAITDPNIHEPKGISSAALNTVYVSNGSGSGNWGKVPVQAVSGVSGAGTAGQALVSNGIGGGVFEDVLASGFLSFINIGTPYTQTYPSAYAKVGVTTVAGGFPKQFTEATTQRLTYTGTRGRVASIKAVVGVSQASGSARDIRIAVYKNGAIIANSEAVVTSTTAQKHQLVSACQTTLATNDYLEVYILNSGASGDILIPTFQFEVNAR